MSTEKIVSLLIAERTKLDAAIQALQGVPEKSVYDDPTMPDGVRPTAKKTPSTATQAAASPSPKPAKRKLSAAGRKAIIEGTKRRWAAIRASKEAAVAAASPAVGKTAAPAATKPTKKVAKRKTWTPAMKKAHTARMKAFWAAKKKVVK